MKKQKTKFLIMALAIFSFFGFVSIVVAGTAHVTWNKNTENDLDGYKIYYDTSSHAGACPTGYTNSFDVTDETAQNPEKWFDTLTPGQTYYFQITAYDTSTNESPCGSAEVSKLVTYRGDINPAPDHAVDVSDLGILAGVFGQTASSSADIDRSGTIDVSDLGIMAGEFGQSF